MFLSFDFFLLCPCTTEQWLVYHSLRNPALDKRENHPILPIYITVIITTTTPISFTDATMLPVIHCAYQNI
jgi:hypothetical protein